MLEFSSTVLAALSLYHLTGTTESEKFYKPVYCSHLATDNIDPCPQWDLIILNLTVRMAIRNTQYRQT